MQILIAEDDPVSRAKLVALLKGQGHEVTATDDGMEAWGAWQIAQPRVVVSDWAMPELDGLEVCRRIRAHGGDHYTYFVLLTASGGRDNFLVAMEAGIDDFITKPVDPDELRARLAVAQRILGLREELHALEGLLPICSYCKRIRNDRDEWSSLEGYIEKRSKAEFSHGVCPDCYRKHLEPHLGPP
jgi:CheY-like chemotaxis protein